MAALTKRAAGERPRIYRNLPDNPMNHGLSVSNSLRGRAYIVDESGNVAAADGVIDAIAERFFLLARYPRVGRPRDDLRPGLRSLAVGQYVIVYTVEDEDVAILHVFHGRQDIEGQLGR